MVKLKGTAESMKAENSEGSMRRGQNCGQSLRVQYFSQVKRERQAKGAEKQESERLETEQVPKAG